MKKYSVAVVTTPSDELAYALMQDDTYIMYSKSITKIKAYAQRLIGMENAADHVTRELEKYREVQSIKPNTATQPKREHRWCNMLSRYELEQ